jgi:hypothetical protein
MIAPKPLRIAMAGHILLSLATSCFFEGVSAEMRSAAPTS